MIKKIIRFENLDGEFVEREYYFNLNKAEILKLQLSEKGGLDKKLKKISENNSYGELLEFIRELVLLSYGEKDEDGIKFIKSKNGVRLADEFEQTEAFSELIMELTQNIDKFNDFINGIIPKSLSEQIKLETARNANKAIEVK